MFVFFLIVIIFAKIKKINKFIIIYYTFILLFNIYLHKYYGIIYLIIEYSHKLEYKNEILNEEFISKIKQQNIFCDISLSNFSINWDNKFEIYKKTFFSDNEKKILYSKKSQIYT